LLTTARQISYDSEHSESELAKALVSTLSDHLSEAGVRELDLLVAAKSEEGWPNFPGCGSWGDLSFTLARKLVKLLPSVLRTFLRPEMIKRGYLAKLQHCVFRSGKGRTPTWENDWGAANPECGTVTEAAALQAILDAFLSFGASLDAVFQKKLSSAARQQLHATVITGRKALLKVFYFEFCERPNVHIGVHLLREADLHGTCAQTEVSVKEMVHRRPKFTATHGNHKEIAREMLLKENGEHALKFLLRGGVDGLTPGASLTGLLQDNSLTSLFRGWLHSPQDQTGDITWTATKRVR